MKILRTKVCLMALVGLIAGTVLAQDDDPGLLAFIARSNQRCEELKQKKAVIERQAAQSQAKPEQKAQATRTIAELDNVIAATTKLLQDPGLKTNSNKKEIASRLQSAIAQGNMLVRSAQRELGASPTSAIDRVLDSNIERFTTKVSPGFDGARRASNGDENVVRASGTRFFGIGGNSSAPAPAVAAYRPTTPQSAKAIVDHYGKLPGGVVLEGAAGGLGLVSVVKYDGRYNALVMDDHLVYFMKVPPWDAAALCRAISRDENMRIGVSIGEKMKIFVFGDPQARAAYENTDVARDLFMTDHFLADVVFGWRKWTRGYKFPNGYEPQTAEVTSDMLVLFAFKGFQFRTSSGELGLVNLSVEATMIPVSKKKAKDGGMLPDYEALNPGYAPPPEFLANAQYLTAQFDKFFRRERIVAKTLAYGELAALLRSYKLAGVNLEALALDLVR